MEIQITLSKEIQINKNMEMEMTIQKDIGNKMEITIGRKKKGRENERNVCDVRRRRRKREKRDEKMQSVDVLMSAHMSPITTLRLSRSLIAPSNS